MEEESCEATHRDIDRDIAIEKIGYDLFMRRTFRFMDGVEKAHKDPDSAFSADPYFTDKELKELYLQAGEAGLEAIDAYVKFKELLRDITHRRRQIAEELRNKQNMRRTLGFDALRMDDTTSPKND